MQNDEPQLQDQTLDAFLVSPCQRRTASRAETNGDDRFLSDAVDPAQEGSLTSKPRYHSLSKDQINPILQDSAQCKVHTYGPGVREGEYDSCSATPYSWSVSDRRESHIDPSFENYVDSLALAGLDTSRQQTDVNQNKKYWTLEELKRLLEKHQRPCGSASTDFMTTGNSPSLAGSQYPSANTEMNASRRNYNEPCESDTDESPLGARCEAAKCDRNINDQGLLPTSIPNSPTVELEVRNPPQNELSGAPLPAVKVDRDLPSSRLSEDARFLSLSGITRDRESKRTQNRVGPTRPNRLSEKIAYDEEFGVENGELNSEENLDHLIGLQGDDELFLQALDTAYNAIVHPGDAMREESRSTNDIAQEDDNISTGSSQISRHKTSATPKAGQQESLPILGPSAHLLSPPSYRLSTGNSFLSGGSSVFNNVKSPAPKSRRSYSDNFNTVLSTREQKPVVDPNARVYGFDHTPCSVPQGFWRQNKLY